MSDASHAEMVHRLPRARLVDRIEFLAGLARGRRVVHVGFVDAGFEAMQARSEEWLHEHLDRSARELVGIDIDPAGVKSAADRGYEAYELDCRDVSAVAALGLDPADLVIAGEVLEHIDDPAAFLEGLHALVGEPGSLVVTVPNATGLLNTVAAVVGREVQHPDHVAMYTWQTLSNLLRRHGWETTQVATFVREVKVHDGAPVGVQVLGFGARVVRWIEWLAGKLGVPFLAEGLIVVARPVRGADA